DWTPASIPPVRLWRMASLLSTTGREVAGVTAFVITNMASHWKHRRVTVLGAGRSGLAAVQLLERLGARVFLSEGKRIAGQLPKGVESEQGRHTHRALEADLIIRSPGVPNHLPI